MGHHTCKIAKLLAEPANLPLMVHVAEPPPLIDEVFDILSPGDIVTHCFNGKKAGSIRDNAALFEQARRLADRGVRMDIGHGQASFCFATARASITDGLRPWPISTDLHLRNIHGSMLDLATTASKLMAVGLTLEDTIAAITTRPRETLGLAVTAQPGTRADFTIFRVDEAAQEVVDSQGHHLRLDWMVDAGAYRHSHRCQPCPRPAEACMSAQAPALTVDALRVEFAGWPGALTALRDVSFYLSEARKLALVGESRSGKTTLGRTLLRLIEPTSASTICYGCDLNTLGPAALRALCASVCRSSFRTLYRR
jgi:ABC-type multidrug transport system fused ATPase/permease subunit